MSMLRKYWRPAAVVAAVFIVDLGARLILGFEMSRIVAFEAVLFGIAGAILIWMARRYDAANPFVRRLALWLAVFFLLGCLRAALWTAGVAVFHANLVVFVAAALAGTRLLLRRRKARPALLP